ncbi:hypothetical protein C3Z10_21960 (plasmid) [Bacillus velezensis]|uniref:Uncharacterized protein n=1 Tax=Bacillus velezensis TaxID=492670 RepID=A0ABC8DG05_BACVE|nr:hypothetical protein C3Z10_21960 [Bacillus velezensis]AWX74616.1 hypothetical protein BVDSYZ_21470 [Bacillus velezensis]
MRSWSKGKVGRSAPVFLGDGSTGGEEQELKKRGQIRKTRRDQGQRGSQSAARSWPKGKVGRSASASLGGGNTGGEEQELKECGCFREIRQVARANVAVGRRCEAGRKVKSADRCPHAWPLSASAVKSVNSMD